MDDAAEIWLINSRLELVLRSIRLIYREDILLWDDFHHALEYCECSDTLYDRPLVIHCPLTHLSLSGLLIAHISPTTDCTTKPSTSSELASDEVFANHPIMDRALLASTSIPVFLAKICRISEQVRQRV